MKAIAAAAFAVMVLAGFAQAAEPADSSFATRAEAADTASFFIGRTCRRYDYSSFQICQ